MSESLEQKIDMRLEISKIVGAMLDGTQDYGIYQTGKCYDALEALFSRLLAEQKQEPISIKQIIWALEARAANTDTSPRWQAAAALRRVTQWESATLPIAKVADEEAKRLDWLDRNCRFVANSEYNIGPYKIGQLRQMADAGIAADAAMSKEQP